VLVEVRLKEGVADPEGSTILRALRALGFQRVESVSVGKAIRLEVEAEGPEDARRVAEDAASRLLANPVLERTEVRVIGTQSSA
jgi:phosphoribosylformylglycinamidine synthase PurS subunit